MSFVATSLTPDLYKTNKGLKDIAAQHPDNRLLAGRGPPGTHDPELASTILAAVQSINQNSETVRLPIFDKSLCGGEGDRRSDTVDINGPLDVFILEGWSMGFAALAEDELRERHNSKKSLSDTSYFLEQPLSSLITLNNYLSDFSAQVYPPFGTIVQIEPESYNYVFSWRLEQEHNMKKANGGKGMTDDQVHAFVERYMPGYELWKEGVWSRERPWAGKGLRLWYGKDREVIKVEVPESETAAPDQKAEHKGSAEPKDGSAPAASEVIQTTPAKSDSSPPTVKSNSKPIAPKIVEPAPTNPDAPRPFVKSTLATPSSKPFNPGWSRKFLAGKSPLIPSYDQIPSLSTLHQDSQILAATPDLVFFPIQGPGGRIGVHPLKKKGRMQVGGEGYLSGGVEVTDFAVEPFKRDQGVRIALAGEDGIIRVWSIDENGVNGTMEPGHVLKGEFGLR